MAKVFLADKETQDKIYNIVRDDQVYGFIEHMAESNPAKRIEYIGANKDFTPLTQDLSQSKVNYGSWADFPVITGNKPWMVLANGAPDYRLKEDDYTKKLDGTNSDVNNTNYKGGAYAWLPRVYTRQEVYGDERYVYFSFVKRDGFEAIGFREWNGTGFDEFAGVWLPMFYGSRVSSVVGVYRTKTGDSGDIIFITSQAGQDVFVGNGKVTSSSLIEAVKTWKGDPILKGYRLLQGAILNTITDLLILLSKTTDLKSVFGKGCQNRSGGEHLKNDVIDGGAFKGTADGNSLNKIFHSIVLGSYQIGQVDATMTSDTQGALLLKKEISDDYEQVATVATDGAWKGIAASHVKKEYGAIPGRFADSPIGDDVIKSGNRGSGICIRLSPGEHAGFRSYDLATIISGSGFNGVSVSSMLVPPVGLIP
nr:MAG TPA: hypothetical protein [Caudoviricetes sp.]